MAGVPSPDAFGEALRRFPRKRNKKRVVAKRERRCRSRGEKENAMKVLSLLPRSRFTESGMTLPAVPAVCGRLLPRTDAVHPLHPDHGRGL